jgi:hypothetical protein
MTRRGEDDPDKPKRSWREIDKMRDKAFSRQQAREERDHARLERSPVYERYKAEVSKMFSGGEMPDSLRERLDPSGELKARDDLLRRIKKTASEDRKAWIDSVAQFVEKHELPADAYLAADWLDHPNEPVVDKALSRLEQMLADGALAGTKRPKALDQRLRSLELKAEATELQARAKALRERLR